MVATHFNQPDIVKFLVREAKAVCNGFRYTPANENTQNIQDLTMSVGGKTALDWAERLGHRDVAKHLKIRYTEVWSYLVH